MTAPTDRQRVVLAVMLRSGSRKCAAAELGISEHTVRGHLAGLYRRLGVRSAAEAARELGWLQLPEDSTDVVLVICVRPMHDSPAMDTHRSSLAAGLSTPARRPHA